MSDREDLLREHGELKAQVTRLKMELAVAHRERDSARADALEEAQVEVKMMAASEAGGPGFNDGYAIARRDAIAAIGALRGTAVPTDPTRTPFRTPFGLPIFPTTKTKSDCANTLEDAARVVEGASIPLSLSNRIPPDAFRLIVARDEAIAKAIRALKPTPTPDR